MNSQHNSSRKKKPGRPAIGRGVQVNAMVRPSLIVALDAYCEQTGKRRTDAVRDLLKLGLASYNAAMAESGDYSSSV